MDKAWHWVLFVIAVGILIKASNQNWVGFGTLTH